MKYAVTLAVLFALGSIGVAHATVRISSDVNSDNNHALDNVNYYRRMLRCWVMQYHGTYYTTTGTGATDKAFAQNAAGAVFSEGERAGCNGCQKRAYIYQNINFQATKVAVMSFTVGQDIGQLRPTNTAGQTGPYVMDCSFSNHTLDLR